MSVALVATFVCICIFTLAAPEWRRVSTTAAAAPHWLSALGQQVKPHPQGPFSAELACNSSRGKIILLAMENNSQSCYLHI